MKLLKLFFIKIAFFNIFYKKKKMTNYKENFSNISICKQKISSKERINITKNELKFKLEFFYIL